MDDLPAGVTGIDTVMGGVPGLTAAFLVGGSRPALVETGPGLAADRVAAALGAAGVGPRDLGWIVVTHVHLDHAGGAGELARRFPAATVVVHPLGAGHLADPRRLLASSARVHGPLMGSVYGSMAPVPAERVVAAADGSSVDLGGRRLEVLHTPGHARHHLALLDSATGALFPGDAAGVLVAPMRVPRPATPPPDFDREAAVASLRRMSAREPARLVFTHFGDGGSPADRLAQAEEALLRWCEVAELAARPPAADPAAVEAALRTEFLAGDEFAARRPDGHAVFGGYAANAAGLFRWARADRGR